MSREYKACVEWTTRMDGGLAEQKQSKNVRQKHDQVMGRDLEISRHGMIGTKPLQLGDMVTMEIL